MTVSMFVSSQLTTDDLCMRLYYLEDKGMAFTCLCHFFPWIL